MLIIKLNSNRILFINEYWILIPLALVIDITIIVSVRRSRAKKRKELESENVNKRCLKLKLFQLATSTFVPSIFTRGGDLTDYSGIEPYADASYPNCIVGEGLRYVDNQSLRTHVIKYFKRKAIKKIIFVTKTALCHLMLKEHIQVPILSFFLKHIGIIDINRYELLRKTVIVLIGSGGILAVGLNSLYCGIALFASSFILQHYTQDANFEFIPTTFILDSNDSIKPRIKNERDVVVVDFSDGPKDKITMSNPTPGYECSLPDQFLGNPKCNMQLTSTQINEITTNIDYDKVVNMEDVTGLKKINFNDRLEVSKDPIAAISDSSKFKRAGKTVNFLDKFGDSGLISESDKWDAYDSNCPAPVNNIRVPDKKT